jgi:hypothetical protein
LTIAEDQFVEDGVAGFAAMHDSLAVQRVDREPARELLAAKELSQFVEREIARDAGTNGRVQQ